MLNRLIEDPEAVNRVARCALELMHFDEVEPAIDAGDPDLLVEREEEACVRGCYRCLLSYYNQPDHELIDRRSPEVLQLLVDLARGKLALTTVSTDTNPARGWSEVFDQHGIPTPNGARLTLDDVAFPFTWRSHYVAAKTGSIPEVARAKAADQGWVLFELPSDHRQGLPSELIAAFEE